jgi:hypothetical protein
MDFAVSSIEVRKYNDSNLNVTQQEHSNRVYVSAYSKNTELRVRKLIRGFASSARQRSNANNTRRRNGSTSYFLDLFENRRDGTEVTEFRN